MGMCIYVCVYLQYMCMYVHMYVHNLVNLKFALASHTYICICLRMGMCVVCNIYTKYIECKRAGRNTCLTLVTP